MAGIYSALGELDRMRKMAGRRVKDVVKDPLGVLTQQADALRNTQRGVDPVINAAGAGMRQIPREEQVSRMTQQALDTYAGGLGMLGHTVFHGSPRAFSKFDKAKMGTGEGNQAFGKGMYVAENPDVAKEYLNVGLSMDPSKATYGGKKIQSLYDAAQRKQDLGHRTRNQSMIEEANAELSYWEDLMVGTHPAAARERAANPDSGWPTLQKFAESIDDKKFKGVDFPDSSLYKVDIPDEVVPNMLAWDKPLKEQPATVQKALKKLGVTQPKPADRGAIEAAKEAFRADPSRENLQAMNALMGQGRNIMGSDIIKQGLATEEALQQAGIPGIKYLDAGSRESGGTSNMVVFSPEMMRILERNGEATGARPWAAGEWGGKPGGFLDTSNNLIPTDAKTLQAYGLEPDMISRIRGDENYAEGISKAQIDAALANRARYRAEPATTPGPNASEEEWAAWGAGHGVDDFRVSPIQSLGLTDPKSGREMRLPGGTEGRFTIPDMFWLKGNNFDPNALPMETRQAIQKKFMRTHQPNPDVPIDDVGLFNALQFSIFSPNQPLTQNEFMAMRARVTNMDELKALAAMAGREGLDTARGVELGVQGAAKGGMGVRGTPSMANSSILAQQILDKPEMFRAGPGETVHDVAIRLMNQTPGLSQKTAGLGVPTTDLARGNSAAVDLHMIRNGLPALLDNPELGQEFLTRANTVLKANMTKEELLAQLRQEIDDPNAAQKTLKTIRAIIEKPEASVYRDKFGNLGRLAMDNPAIAPEKLISEPAQAKGLGRFYQAMLDEVDRSRGANPELPLFPQQWMLWDGYRGRLEPHEFMHPDYQKLPKQSWQEMSDAFQAHKDAGYTNRPTSGQTPVMGETDWRKLYYGHADPRLLGGIAAGGGAALASDPEYLPESFRDFANTLRMYRQ